MFNFNKNRPFIMIIRVYFLVLVISIGMLNLASVSSSQEASITDQSQMDPYILLVSFYTKKGWQYIDEKWIDAINNSPYDGIGVMIDKVVSSQLPVNNDSMTEKLKFIRDHSKKHIWPWVFFNRFIQRPLEKKETLSESEWAYFSQINRMDIFNQSGALGDFKNIFRMALRFAKHIGTPGIIVDPEAYNDRRVYDLDFLSRQMSRSKKDIFEQLTSVGRELAKIVAEEYPTAILWFITMKPNRSTTMITEALIDEAVISSIPLKVVESSIGYVSANVEELEQKIINHKITTEKWRQKYGNFFCTGGRIALTDKPESRRGFIKKQYRFSGIKSVDDLKPVLSKLFESYRYVFIYAAVAAQFDPFDPEKSQRYHSVIRDVLKSERLKKSLK